MAFMITRIFAVATLALAVSAQYDGYNGGYKSGGNPGYNSLGHGGYQKPVAILSHKQAQSHDGAVNFGFSAENGIHQGETINPDGSRSGSYSYVDPNGKTVSLKYIAGKDGFHVLEGDHIPKAVPLPAAHQAAHAEAYARGSNPEYNSPSPYRAPSGSYNKRPYHISEASEDHSSYEAPQQSYRAAEDDYQSTGPHAYGPGYAFQFGSH